VFLKEQLIDIAEIDLNDQRYRISINNDINSLVDSIAKNGLFTPCILRKTNNHFIVVSGFRRILSMKKLKLKNISARIIMEDTDNIDLYCIKIAIGENAFHCELNVIELAKSISLLKQFLNFTEIEKISPTIFNTPLNRKIIEQLFAISSMDESVHYLISAKKLSMKNIIKIAGYDQKTFEAFIDIFQKVKMGQNKQAEIIINCHEVASRDNIALHDFLSFKDIKKIIDHENPDENHKGNLLRSYLAKKRYPKLTSAYEEHKAVIKELKLEPEIKLQAPKDFEGDKYSIFFEFRNRLKFEEHLKKLISINRTKIFDKLIK